MLSLDRLSIHLWHPPYHWSPWMEVWAEDKDTEDWVCVQTLGDPGRGHTSTVWAVSFNSLGNRLVSCSDDCSLIIWDTSNEQSEQGEVSWKHLCSISGYHDRTIFSVNWSPVSGIIATACGDDCIRLFSENLSNGEVPSYKMILKKDKAHDTDVNCVRWHPKEPLLLASAGDDGVVKIWKILHEQAS